MATIVLILGACGGGAVLSGCGGAQTKTVIVASGPQASQTTTTPTPHASPTSTATTPQSKTQPQTTTTGGGTAGSSTTRTAPEPSFTQHEAPAAEGVSAAAAIVRAQGFTPNNTSEYHSNQALRVLIGTRTGSGDGYGQQAFFFLNGRYIGTDAKEPSATLKVVSQGETEVTLAYPLYRKNDPLCCPGGGQATVRFQLNDGKLTPLDPIPPASSTSGVSRN